MLRKAGIALIVLVTLIALVITALIRRPPPPDSQAFINGTILTMNPDNEIAEAI